MRAEDYKNQSAFPGSVVQQMPGSSLFFVGIIFTGDNRLLAGTLKSAIRQKLAGQQIAVHIFYDQKELPVLEDTGGISLVPYSNSADFFQKFTAAVEQCPAAYCTVLWNGDEFFDSAFDSVDRIFKKYSEINWLTGIQTFQAPGGYNITLGTTAVRRWSYKIYERNLYKNSGRYIPPASTFWRKSIWATVSPALHFVSQKDFCEDLWLTFFKTQKLYTSKIYFSTSHNYEKLDKHRFTKPNSYAPIEDNILGRIKEFFFVNNIPYLRLFYRHESELTPVVRFDHNTQSYFLSEY